MNDPITTLLIALLTLLAIAASAVALRRLRQPERAAGLEATQRWLVMLCAAGAGGVFLYRAVVVHHSWQPLQAHVDGLLLISALVAVIVLYLQRPSRMPGVGAFALPVLSLLLAWAICASAWTLHFFNIDSVWRTLHLASVYLGSIFLLLAAVAGGMYLYAQQRLRRKVTMASSPRLASLESIERFIIGSSALGFATLTLGLITGLVIITSERAHLSLGWWYSAKIALSAAVWLIYAVVMNVRHAASFRGRRAAWLSVAGLVLLIVTFAVATALPADPPPVQSTPAPRQPVEQPAQPETPAQEAA